MGKKKEPNGILFESESHVMIEINNDNGIGRIMVPKNTIKLKNIENEDNLYDEYYLITDGFDEWIKIKKETYYGLLDILFGKGVEPRLKIMESAGVAKEVYGNFEKDCSESASVSFSMSASPSPEA